MSNISGTIKSIQDIMRKDTGVDGDAQRISQLVWMFFLKIFDDREEEIELLEDNYVSPLPEELRWRNWAADAEGITGEDLSEFVNTQLFPHLKNKLQQSILQLAVMGKLVPQDPDDEPASELLKRIAVEKAELVESKVIKKQKALPGIGQEEKPFELPVGWEWCRLGNIGYDLGGGTPSKSNEEFWNGTIPWVSPKDMKFDYIEKAQVNITEKAVCETTVKYIPKNSLLIVVRGMILAHSFPVAINLYEIVINQDMKALVFNNLLPSFVLLQMKSTKSDVVRLVDRSSHGTCKLVSEKLWNIIITIPPINEQHRIVARVDELMTLCDQLKIRLAEAQNTQLQLADTVTEQAVN